MNFIYLNKAFPCSQLRIALKDTAIYRMGTQLYIQTVMPLLVKKRDQIHGLMCMTSHEQLIFAPFGVENRIYDDKIHALINKKKV